MEQKKYLKWYNKIGYGSGDIAGNVVYAFLTSFVMIYLTDTVGLNSGVIGTLIMVSKLLDGVSDVFFGSMIDKTKSKMGKARPWMFYGFFGCALTLFGVFAIPTNIGQTAQYADAEIYASGKAAADCQRDVGYLFSHRRQAWHQQD